MMPTPPWDGTGAPPTGYAAPVKPVQHRYESVPQAVPQQPEVPAEPEEQVELFDPADHTVAEVRAYLADHPDETDDVLTMERAGKARLTLLNEEN